VFAMDVWSREGVLSHAPDRASARAAAALADIQAWRDTGADPSSVWGVWTGGSQAYQIVVDLSSPPAYACSCPSRKVPCKHTLGLLLQWSAGKVLPGEPPDFVAAWLRTQSARRSQPPPEGRQTGELADPVAAAKRATARAERVASGLDELDQWLCDQVRGGIAGLERAGYAPSRVLEQLGALHLLVQAHRRLDQLPADLAATVRARIGYSVSKAEVLALPGVLDHWFAVGMVDTAEYRLDTRRVWLHGAVSGRWAVIISFAPPGGMLDAMVMAGHVLHATLHFYPGAGQFRALLGEQISATAGPTMPPAESFADVRVRFAQLVASDPWAVRMPAAIKAVPVPGARGWRLRADDGTCCDIVDLPEEPWPLLARSAGEPIEVFGEWTTRGFRPLSLLGADATEPFSTAVVARAA
jgi:SWIM zinc finger